MAYHPFRHLGLKGVSVGLAVLLWLTVAREPTVERNLRIPLHFQNLPTELQIVGEPPNGVDVRVRGLSGQLGRLQPGDIVAILDLRSARPGARMFNLFAEHVQGPLGVSVEQVLTPTVPLEFERIAVRIVPVVPAIEGEPARGFVVGQVSASPATVEVMGPESRLFRVVQATTDPVSVDEATTTVRDVVTIGVSDSALRLRQARTASVTVEIVVGPTTRNLSGVPIRTQNLEPSAEATLAPGLVSILVRGTIERVDGLSVDSISAYVDASDLGPGEHLLPVRTEAPPDVTVERIEPSDIRLRIK